MNTLLVKLKAWYYGHVQKTLGGLLGGFAFADLISSFTSYESELTELFTRKGYAIIRLAGAAIIVMRASHKQKPPQEDPPK